TFIGRTVRLAGDRPATAAKPMPIQLRESGDKRRDRNTSKAAGTHMIPSSSSSEYCSWLI
ncbi:MAG: hypothetical protein V3R58_06070, partial [candidate division NC10 bacterium]